MKVTRLPKEWSFTDQDGKTSKFRKFYFSVIFIEFQKNNYCLKEKDTSLKPLYREKALLLSSKTT